MPGYGLGMTASSSPATSSSDSVAPPRSVILVPAGGVKPVFPPWLSERGRSTHHSTSRRSSPKSCWKTPLVHSAAVTWYSGSPNRFPRRSAGVVISLSSRM